MDRSDWIKEKRREAEAGYSNIWAPEYGEKWGTYPNAIHQQFIHRFLSLLPEPGTSLDAACGAGRYMGMLLEAGHAVVGIDQSQGMLDNARAKYPGVRLEKAGLQEMAYDGVFDGLICMDAVEHVFPEDWGRVLANFHRALKPDRFLYFTVEVDSSERVEAAFARGREMGLPVVHGEWADGEVYHYYPPLDEVRRWLEEARFELVEEA